MRRRLLNLLTALSLLLFVPVCVLWVRSCWHPDTLSIHVARSGTDPVAYYEITLASESGGLAVGYDAARSRYSAEDIRRAFPRGWGVSRHRWARANPGFDDGDAATAEWQALGVRLYRYRSPRPGGDHSVSVTLPAWLVVLSASMPAALWLVSRRQARRRVEMGHCTR